MKLFSLPAFLRRGRGEPSAIIHSAPSGWVGGGADALGRFGVLGSILPGSNTDWAQEVGDIGLNSVVAACLRWIVDNLPEPARQVLQAGKDEPTPLPSHPLLDLLDTPNEGYDGDSLLGAVACDYALTGNGYWLKERDNLGRVRKLWHAPFWTMAPQWPNDGSQFITHYLYRPNGTSKPVPYKREDVVHFRWGLDGRTGGRLGTHRTQPFLTCIASLNEAGIYTPTLLRNMGIIPYLVTNKTSFSAEAIDGLRAWWQRRFTRDERGKPGFADGGEVDVKKLGLSPEEMRLNEILDRPEVYVCNAFGIHPGVLYLGGAGGKGFDNGGQLAEARRASYHDCLMPMTKRFGKTITHQLLTEFEEQPASKVYFGFDFGTVEALQEDQDALHKRLDNSFLAGWLTRKDVRVAAGKDVTDADDVYLLPKGGTLIHADATPEELAELNKPVAPGTEPGSEPDAEPGEDDAGN